MDRKSIHRFLALARKPSRYVGNEINSLFKTDENLFNGVLVGADLYENCMPDNGFRRLYSLLNKSFKSYWERAFLPEAEAGKYLLEDNLKLFTLEKFEPVISRQAVIVYIRDVSDLLNLFLLFKLLGIPANRDKRDEIFPPVYAVGPGIVNPTPFIPFFDALFWGEWEFFIPLFGKIFQPGFDRKKTDELLRKEPNVIVEVHPQQKKYFALTGKLSSSLYPAKLPLPRGGNSREESRVETAKGTFSSRRFHPEDYHLRPLRQRRMEDILTEVKGRIRYNGERVFRLSGVRVEEYESLTPLLRRLKSLAQEEGIRFYIDGLIFDPAEEEMEGLKALTKNRFNIPLYTVDEKLRRMQNLAVPVRVYEEMIFRLMTMGWEHFQFELMIGLPRETDDSLLQTARWLNGLQHLFQMKSQMTIRVKVTPFVPFPFTPMQWAGQLDASELERRREILERNIKLPQCSWEKNSFTEPLLKTILLRKGENFISEAETVDLFDSAERSEMFIEKNRGFLNELSLYDELPWGEYAIPVSDRHLRDEWMKSLNGEPTYDCGNFKCYQCGVQRNPYGEISDCYQKAAEHPVPEKYQYVFKKLSADTGKVITYGRTVKRRDSNQQQLVKKLRIKYARKNFGVYLSQADVGNDFERAAKVSGFPLAFTQGKTPKPKISYGLALPLGYESDAEYFDAEILVLREAGMLEKINRMMPSGITILEARSIFKKVPSLMNSIDIVSYRIHPYSEADNAFLNDLSGALKILWREEQIFFGDEENNIDLKEYWSDYYADEKEIRFQFRVIEGKTIKPDDLIAKAGEFNNFASHLVFTRTGQFYEAKNGKLTDPMEFLSL
jgi:radical SAM-linked protein